MYTFYLETDNNMGHINTSKGSRAISSHPSLPQVLLDVRSILVYFAEFDAFLTPREEEGSWWVTISGCVLKEGGMSNPWAVFDL